MSEHWAYPGCRCVCIRDVFKPTTFFVLVSVLLRGTPKKGETYTIKNVVLHKSSQSTGVVLEGFPGVVYAAACFRPIVDRTMEDDVALFKKLIQDMPEHADA